MKPVINAGTALCQSHLVHGVSEVIARCVLAEKVIRRYHNGRRTAFFSVASGNVLFMNRSMPLRNKYWVVHLLTENSDFILVVLMEAAVSAVESESSLAFICNVVVLAYIKLLF